MTVASESCQAAIAGWAAEMTQAPPEWVDACLSKMLLESRTCPDLCWSLGTSCREVGLAASKPFIDEFTRPHHGLQ